jgi:hypothetical protein
MNIKSALAKLTGLVVLAVSPMAFANWSVESNWASGSRNNEWTIEVPSTATVIYSRVGAWSSMYFVDQGGGQGYWAWTFSNSVAGVAGPPSGLIHEASASSSYGGTPVYDDKRDYNHPAGEYQIFHAGGTSDATHGQIYAYTEIDW